MAKPKSVIDAKGFTMGKSTGNVTFKAGKSSAIKWKVGKNVL